MVTVTVTGVSGTGTLGLSLGGGHTITDIAGNALPGGNPADTELYHVDRDAPGLVSINRVTDDDLLAENIAKLLLGVSQRLLEGSGVRVLSVRVFETPNCSATAEVSS